MTVYIYRPPNTHNPTSAIIQNTSNMNDEFDIYCLWPSVNDGVNDGANDGTNDGTNDGVNDGEFNK